MYEFKHKMFLASKKTTLISYDCELLVKILARKVTEVSISHIWNSLYTVTLTMKFSDTYTSSIIVVFPDNC